MAQLQLDSSSIFPLVSEEVVRDSNSIDIQLCVGGLLTTDSVAFQSAAATQLAALLSSTAIYLTRVYTIPTGDLCLLYVFEAPNPSSAQLGLARLSPPGQLSGHAASIIITGQGVPWPCTVTASPWQVMDASPMGVPLPFQWSANELLLWGLCGGGFLLAAALGTCCCALRLSFHRDDATLRAILATDKKVAIKVKKISEDRVEAN